VTQGSTGNTDVLALLSMTDGREDRDESVPSERDPRPGRQAPSALPDPRISAPAADDSTRLLGYGYPPASPPPRDEPTQLLSPVVGYGYPQPAPAPAPAPTSAEEPGRVPGYGYPPQQPARPVQPEPFRPAPPGPQQPYPPQQVNPQQAAPQQGFAAQQGFAPQQAGPQQGFPPPRANPPQQGFPPSPPLPGLPVPPSNEPDWSSLADQHDARARRTRRLRIGGIALAVCVVVAGGVVALQSRGGKPTPHAGPTASATATGPSASASGPTTAPSASSTSPTVPGQPGVLADQSGQSDLALGPGATVSSVQNGFVASFDNASNSYAQSADPVVDTTKGFSVSAWVYNQAHTLTRAAISQGDGVSYSFMLGRDIVNGRSGWTFSVQTGGNGADSTVYEARVNSASTVGDWALLTGVYSASKHTIQLYVNAVPGATVTVPGIWTGTGPLQLGRDRHHGLWDDSWDGVIGHIQIWNQPLDQAEVTNVKNGGSGLSAHPVASWLVG